MKVIIYARVSTTHQNVEQQVKVLKEYANGRGWEVVRVVADTESGRLPLFERKRFSKMLSNLEGIDAVLVFNIDRITRNWNDEAKLENVFSQHCKLISMMDGVDLTNASGRLMFRIKMAVASFYIEDMFEKQAVGIDRARKEGKYKGRRPRV